MAQFDVHEGANGLLLDCQSDLLSHFNSRLVVPLLPADRAPPPVTRLNPTFEVGGKAYVMVTHYAAAVEVRELGEVLASLADRHHEIMNALDFLLTGV